MIEAVPHELEFAIGGYKADGAVAVKFAQLDTLVELAIVNLDRVGCFSMLSSSVVLVSSVSSVIHLQHLSCLMFGFTPYLLLLGSFSNKTLSFNPNLHSGVPERYALIMIWPATSARKTLP